MSVETPTAVDRLIVHQFDPARPSPGGIDTCLRGIARYAPRGQRLAVVGVDTGSGPSDRELGRWEQHKFGENTIDFLPVVKIDPADQKRLVPHSLRLAAGLVRYLRRLPKTNIVQAHRMDTGLLLSSIMPSRKFVYYVHTQENGLTGKTSDSFWKRASRLHAGLERMTARKAEETVVFNEEYATVLASWTSGVRFSPTWFDPRLMRADPEKPQRNSICWVGRLEIPKDPSLALSVVRELNTGGEEWKLDVVGSGTLHDSLKDELKSMPRSVAENVTLHGRVSPETTAELMKSSSVFLMTSHPGYEGYPRVLVEALASGLPAVVTEGSDTGALVVDSRTGFVCNRDPKEIASRILEAQSLDNEKIRASVTHLSAPQVVDALFAHGRRP
ncbi:glycosyltransferase family 4 protein [Arthrobacter gengyunqii]|uniref:D-inositol 3-phosphate glycosyltransferase n=1 Tax=Arthrobacter gengyunqii TaxID=2886940 RepID=A0ABS8GIS7_9MICC|nr:glycosyltransferase family 4 protein [Arthrobacter gengyunqii]MCC3266574.1 glycosyltransferase family 4 protein [Arthrobacter gengyunqii]